MIGIDPGFSGAIGIIGDNGEYTAVDMPVIGEGAQKTVDGLALDMLMRLTSPRLIVIEQVSARPGQGVTTMFRFGAAYGAALAIALAQNCPVELVVPAKWKRKYGLIGSGKEASRALAIRKYPAARDSLKRKKDDGRAEALLLADYGLHFV